LIGWRRGRLSFCIETECQRAGGSSSQEFPARKTHVTSKAVKGGSKDSSLGMELKMLVLFRDGKE
jgi:hypothetical protein